MRQPLKVGKVPNLNNIIIASAVLHLIFITLITIPLKTKDREYKTYFVNIVSPTRVQGPAVKKKGKTSKTTVKAKPALRRRVRSKKGVSLVPLETARVSREIDKLRAINALKKKKQTREEELARAREADEALEQAIEGIKERRGKISLGSAIPSTRASSEINEYYALLIESITNNWVLPDFDISDLEVIISFRVNNKGEVSARKVITSSGNVYFDRSAMNAIIKASPLPPPVLEEEVEVRFRDETGF